jgi:hypothetical protein
MGTGQNRSTAVRNKVVRKYSDMAALSALERLQLELAEARQALVKAERQRRQERQWVDEAELQQVEQERATRTATRGASRAGAAV